MSPLSPTQVFILKALAKRPVGMTRKALEETIGVGVTADSLGPTFVDDLEKHPDSLLARRLVTFAEPVDGDETHWTVTAKGKAAAQSHTALARIEDKEKIPPKTLDAAVLKVRALKAYGLERYTDQDIAEIRQLLGPKFRRLSVDSIRHQIVGRRKARAYVDEKACRLRSYKRILREFGPDGTVSDSFLTEPQLDAIALILEKSE